MLKTCRLTHVLTFGKHVVHVNFHEMIFFVKLHSKSDTVEAVKKVKKKQTINLMHTYI